MPLPPEKAREYARAHYQANREKILARKREYDAAHREEKRAYDAEYRKRTFTPAPPREKRFDPVSYRLSVAEKRRAQSAAWAKANPEKKAAKDSRRRATLAGGKVELTAEEKRLVEQYHAFRRFLTELYGVRFAVDHIVPLSAGGKDHPDNYQLITHAENCRKRGNLGHILPDGAFCFRLTPVPQ